MDKLLEMKGIRKSYGATVKTPVLKGIDLSFERGDFSAIIGQSGSGKSTLLNMIGVLDRPEQGTMLYQGSDLYTLSDEQLARFRSRAMGFVFQYHHLLPEFTAVENVLIPYRIAHGRVTASARSYALELLKRVGVEERMNNRATNLSGGQQQRVAIARALMNKPEILLADEPTGNLDSDASENIRSLMREINKELQTTFIIVTHDRHIAASCDRVIEIADGHIVDDVKVRGMEQEQAWDRLSPCYCRMRQQAAEQHSERE
jgi:lipoprotein-releasing system ATP-binding protein